MPRKPSGKPAGRPEKPIDWSQFEQLCALQCTQLEIANVLHIHPNTLSDRVLSNYGDDYSTTYKRFSDIGKCSLRRYQFVQSKTNTSMAIWLGKNWLGQRDPGFEEHKGDVIDAIKAAVREIQGEPRIESSGRSLLENKQSLLDQELRGAETKVQVKLGARNTLAREA